MTRRPLFALAVASAFVLASVAPASGATDIRQRRREVQRKRAAVAAKINVLKASDHDVEKALDALNANLKGQQARVAAARQSVGAAAHAVTEARRREQAVSRKLDAIRGTVRDAAVDAYIRGGRDEVRTALESSSLNDAARRVALFLAAVAKGTDAADEVRALKQDVEASRVAADAARNRAAEQRRAMESQLEALHNARAEKLKVSRDVEARLDDALAEADSLSGLDATFAAELAKRNARLAAKVGDSGRAAKIGARRVRGGISVTTVRGITVASSIANNLARLLAAGDAAGIRLSGSGYRDPGQQVALRRAHCGGSSYAVYDMPPSRCRPPTARPGSSMHERGLAVDFAANGSILRRSSAGYRWLRANAGRFGFRNLPSEAWHWSTNGN